MSTFWPGFNRPSSLNACSAVSPASGNAAASSKDDFEGLSASSLLSMQTSSATVPPAQACFIPNTSSPVLNRVTPAPTAVTTPAPS